MRWGRWDEDFVNPILDKKDLQTIEGWITRGKPYKIHIGSDGKRFSTQLYGAFKDVDIRVDCKNLEVELPHLGLDSTIIFDSYYESGYHNSDCGQNNEIYLKNSDLYALLADCGKLYGDDVELSINAKIKDFTSLPNIFENT